MIRRITAMGILLLTAQVAWGQEPQGHWEAYSRTAMAITGPISFDVGVLTINALPAFRYEHTGKDDQYRLLPIGEPNPVFLNGNSLCGADDAPMTMRVRQTEDLLTVAIFTRHVQGADNKPTAEMCGTFSYIRKLL